ncbi:immunoglobulin superfamily member 1-like [Lacerta agilis]|uniref:immunoglobulin superfamily member 1-like n=1 Tax=Lacerta agilis TaxID=80427 RepID=UPI001419C780|nr:immunoglobulin superfamily member 1-like [Lacerta agilis]
MKFSFSVIFLGWWLTGKTLKGQSYPKPSISVVPSKIVPLGGNATIHCKVRSEDYEQATFILFRELDSSLHASVVKKSEWNEVAFFFANVKLLDGGIYRCRYCFNSFSGDSCSHLSDRVKVKIRALHFPKPSISVSPSNIVKLGGNVTIHCNSQGYQDVEFQLYKKVGPSLIHVVMEKAGQKGVVFAIANATLFHGGIYQGTYCFKSTFYELCSNFSNSIYIYIRDPSLSKPSIRMRPEDPLAAGFSVTIECHGPENGLNFSLQKSSNLIAWQMAESDRNTTEFSLSMIRLEDDGNYTCQYHRKGHAFQWSEPSDAMGLELVTANTFPSMEITIRLAVAVLVLLSLVLIVAEFMCGRQNASAHWHQRCGSYRSLSRSTFGALGARCLEGSISVCRSFHIEILSKSVVRFHGFSCGDVRGTKAVHIWMVGNSIVHWARERASQRGWGRNLGLPPSVKISWITRRGMRWDEFLPAVKSRAASQGPPDAMVIQLSENDLAYRKGVDLQWNIFEDFNEIVASFPSMTLFWSTLLERRTWRDCVCPIAVNRARKLLDKAVARRVVALGGQVIPHPAIKFSEAALYRNDGVHLSDEGNDAWLADIVLAIRVQRCWLTRQWQIARGQHYQKPSISVIPSPQVVLGADFYIRCETKHYSEATIYLVKEGSLAAVDSKTASHYLYTDFPLSNAKHVEPNGGVYKCKYCFNTGNEMKCSPYSDNVYVNITGELSPKPSIFVRPSPLVIPGTRFYIYCTNEYREQSTFYLSKEGTPGHLLSRNDSFGAVFGIPNAKQTDGGIYQCSYCFTQDQVRKCSHSSDRVYVNITEQFYPKPSISVNSHEFIALGGNATIRCKSEENPMAEFTLLREDYWGNREIKKMEPGCILFPILNAKGTDGGIYFCTYCFQSDLDFHQQCSNYSDRVYINITDPWLSKPSITLKPTQQISPGMNVSIECQGAKSYVTFSLFKSNNLIASQKTESDRNATKFFFSEVRLEAGGSYTCRYQQTGYSFLWSESSDPMELVVTASPKPSISVSPGEVIALEGNANILCKTKEQQEVEFTLHIENSSNTYKSKKMGLGEVLFPIINAKESDGGTYRCSYCLKLKNTQACSDYSDEVHIKVTGGHSIAMWAGIAAGVFFLVLLLLILAFVLSRKRKKGSVANERTQPTNIPLQSEPEEDPDGVSYAVLSHSSLKTKPAPDDDGIPESCTYATVAQHRTKEGQ